MSKLNGSDFQPEPGANSDSGLAAGTGGAVGLVQDRKKSGGQREQDQINGAMVLCVPAGWENYISGEFDEIHQALVRRGWIRLVIDEMRDADILARIDTARVVLMWEAYELLERNINVLCPSLPESARSAGSGSDSGARIGPKRVFFCDDVHYFSLFRRQQRLRAFEWADLILATYPDKLLEWYPEIPADKVLWMPHAAASWFKPSFDPLLRASDRILLSGSRSWPYPFRQFCQAKLSAAVCDVVDHPGYPGYPGDRHNTMQANTLALAHLGRENYAALLRTYPAMLVCGSIFGYLVAKVVEAMASGCVVIAERSSLGHRLSALGFVDGEHYVGTDLQSVIDDTKKVREAFLHGDPAWKHISATSAQKVASEHTTMMRAHQIHAVCMESELL